MSLLRYLHPTKKADPDNDNTLSKDNTGAAISMLSEVVNDDRNLRSLFS